MDSFREWLSDNLRYILLGLAIILALVIFAFTVKLVSGLGKSDRKDDKSGTVVVETGTDAQTEPESKQPLTKNDASILDTVQRYYDAMGQKDIATLESMVESLTNADRQKIQSSIIESYNNIEVYSKEGPVDGSYVVYAYFEAKIDGIDELIPSLAGLYLRSDESGNLYVADAQADEAASAYIEEMKQDSDVQALIQQVDAAYNAIIENNEQLREIVKELDEPETEIRIPEVGESDAQANQIVQTTDVLNVRADAREDAEKIGVLEVGTQVTRIRILDNGWAEIKYGEATGYVLNEYLQDVSQ